MTNSFLFKSKKAMRLLAITTMICTWLPIGAAAQLIVVPPPDLNPLNQTIVPEPPNLFDFVKNKAAAIRLGKAFFWDMQAGSDGIVSCGTCHFHAGADNRRKNTLNPGTPGGDTLFGNNSIGAPGFLQFGPNYTLDPVNDFPFHEREGSPHLQSSLVLRDTNDVVGSQGVRLSDFTGVVPGSAVDSVVSTEIDPVFNAGGVNLRRVTGRNTPTVINAAFNFTNFWDGRANFLFNGENPFGPADPNAGVWFNEGGALVKRPVTIQFASLASQATGPPMDAVEMSGRGRTFPDLGRKMLSLVPLGKQLVHPGDSVLGSLSRAVRQPDGTLQALNGLRIGYSHMIQDAFNNELWSSNQLTPNGFTQMEANFSLFWGLAIQLYESTLISDQTPFDRWLAGNQFALTDNQKFGFSIFSGIGKCTVCHFGIEFTPVSTSSIAFVNNFDNLTIELMFTSDGRQVIYDDGYTNSAVTPTVNDLGRGGAAPFINPLTGAPFPLAFSDLAKLQAQGMLPFETPILDLFLPVNMPTNVNGAFKVPGLRNVELTGPYFHNGSIMTLDDVMDFYARGGNFPNENIADLDPVIGDGLHLISLNQNMHDATVAFMKSLTDPRVALGSAPFDHPELYIAEGDPEVLTRIPAVNLDGDVAPLSSLSLNGILSPTRAAEQTISGRVEAGLTPVVTVDTSATVDPVTVSGNDWSARISGLVPGANIVTVSAVDQSGVPTTILTSIITLEQVINRTIGGDPGVMFELSTPADNLTLTLNVTNSDGVFGNVAMEWLPIAIQSASTGGLQIFFLTPTGLVAFADAVPSTSTFPFSHATDRMTLATVSLGALGLQPGDVLIYGYLYSTTTVTTFSDPNISLENFVWVNVR